eukprot:3799474-Rhodomonas_salina.1
MTSHAPSEADSPTKCLPRPRPQNLTNPQVRHIDKFNPRADLASSAVLSVKCSTDRASSAVLSVKRGTDLAWTGGSARPVRTEPASAPLQSPLLFSKPPPAEHAKLLKPGEVNPE